VTIKEKYTHETKLGNWAQLNLREEEKRESMEGISNPFHQRGITLGRLHTCFGLEKNQKT